MANIQIQFYGPWQLFLGARAIHAEIKDLNGARDYVESNYGPLFEKKLQSMGVNKKESIWENSNLLINGRKVSSSNNTIFKDGDKLDLLPLVAGG